MPYAKLDVDLRIDPRWGEIPARYRAAAKAVYVDGLLYSAEMLTDGALNRAVIAGIASELGLYRYTKVLTSLCESGLFRATKTGFLIVDWALFQNSRQQVMAARKRDAQRKQLARAQPQLEGFHDPRPADVQGGHASDSRARERAGSAAAAAETTQDLEPSTPSDPAAAASETEPPREQRIREVVEQMPGANRGSVDQVEQIARQLPAAAFERVVEVTLQRRGTRNVVGLLVKLLRGEIEERRRNTAIALAATNGTTAPPPAEAQIRLHIPAIAQQSDAEIDAYLDTLLNRLEVSGDERLRLTDLAADTLRNARAASTTAETPATL